MPAFESPAAPPIPYTVREVVAYLDGLPDVPHEQRAFLPEPLYPPLNMLSRACQRLGLLSESVRPHSSDWIRRAVALVARERFKGKTEAVWAMPFQDFAEMIDKLAPPEPAANWPDPRSEPITVARFREDYGYVEQLRVEAKRQGDAPWLPDRERDFLEWLEPDPACEALLALCRQYGDAGTIAGCVAAFQDKLGLHRGLSRKQTDEMGLGEFFKIVMSMLGFVEPKPPKEPPPHDPLKLGKNCRADVKVWTPDGWRSKRLPAIQFKILKALHDAFLSDKPTLGISDLTGITKSPGKIVKVMREDDILKHVLNHTKGQQRGVGYWLVSPEVH